MLTRTRAVQLDKEKNLRRAWNTHGAQVQIFDAGTDAMANLYHLRDNLETACADPTRTNAGETTEQPSRRKQLVTPPPNQPRQRRVRLVLTLCLPPAGHTAERAAAKLERRGGRCDESREYGPQSRPGGRGGARCRPREAEAAAALAGHDRADMTGRWPHTTARAEAASEARRTSHRVALLDTRDRRCGVRVVRAVCLCAVRAVWRARCVDTCSNGKLYTF